MKRLLAALTAAALTMLAALAATLPALTITPTPALAAPVRLAPRPAVRMPVPAGLATARPAAASSSTTPPGDPRAADTQPWVRVEVNNLNPRVVTSGSTTVKIEGKITNISDRKIESVSVRSERYDAVTSADTLKSAITAPHADSSAAYTDFAHATESLTPGQSVSFQLDAPLTGGPKTSLALSRPGVYPLMVNVNGTPDYGKEARLGVVNTLLPVLQLPGEAPPARPVAPPARPVAPPVTLLWPIADAPNVVGSDGNKIIIRDDSLAASLAPGGRLFRLVDAVDSGLPPTASVAQSLCFAIDPDLLTTVAAMSKGYLVSTGNSPGTGADAAKAWLDKLRTVATGRCVMALPYSDADLVALSRAGLGDLISAALGKDPSVDTAQTFQQLLPGARTVPDVVWPGNGLVDQRTATDLVTNGTKTLLLDPLNLPANTPAGPVRLAVGGATPPLAVPIDPLISSAYNAFGAVPASNTPDMQATLAALVFCGDAQPPGQTVLIAPPKRWDVSSTDLRTLLETTQLLLGAQLMQPKSLALFPAQATGLEPSVPVNYPVAASASEIPPALTSDLRTAWNTQQDLVSSMHPDPAQPHPVDPKQLMAPELLGLLRGSSGAWRGNQPGAQAAIDVVNQQLDSVQQLVQIAVPQTTVRMTSSSDSSLPLSLSNKLPVAVDVQVTLSETAGLHTGAVPVRQVPPTGSSLLLVPAQVNRTGKFSVDVRISTPRGTPLGGDTARLQLRSTNFDTITSYVTGAAGVLLVVLIVIRIVRRTRAARAASAPPTAAASTDQKVVARRDPAGG